MAANWKPKTIWTGDCLDILRGMNSESVDLIYLDPPFNSKANYAAPIGSRAAGAAFKDTWTLSDVDVEWINLIEAKHPILYRVLLAAMTDSDKSYLAYMAARVLELRRVMKPAGSIYLHCDPTMSHYLKLVMDAVFGRRNFRSEITWRRTTSKGLASTGYPNSADVLLYYGKGGEVTWNPPFRPLSPAYVERTYRHVEPETGRRYRLDNLANPNKNRPNLTYEFLGVTRVWRWTQERMQSEYDRGRVVQVKPGAVPAFKRYLDEGQGAAVDTIWDDIQGLQASARERVGYPTQKPLALLSRIIEASSNKGDMVLDPFCGCATTCVAADGLNRQWTGIDISPKAAELVRERIDDLTRRIGHRTDLPKRTDLGKLPAPRTHRAALYGDQAGHCAGCGTHFEIQHFEVDHIISRKKGGTNHVENLQLLCTNCNRIKGDRGMEYLRAKLGLNIAKVPAQSTI